VSDAGPEATAPIAARVKAFVRDVVVPYEQDGHSDLHGVPTEVHKWSLAKKTKRDWKVAHP
jgi:acyl-CoA dehydrogenase